MKALLALLAFTNPAWAACDANENMFMSCQIEKSQSILRVCFDERDVFYRFGPLGQKPDLEISVSIADVDYTPWPGVGQAIWEEVSFQNDGHHYTVHVGFDRMFDEEEYNATPHHGFGGVLVTRGDVEVVALSCSRASVDFGWDVALFEAKTNLGNVWDDRTREWVELPD